MTIGVYGLWPISADGLVGRIGKVYRFVHCMVAAHSAANARALAQKHGPDFGVDWLDPETVACQPVAHFGPMPPEGYVAFGEPPGQRP